MPEPAAELVPFELDSIPASKPLETDSSMAHPTHVTVEFDLTISASDAKGVISSHHEISTVADTARALAGLLRQDPDTRWMGLGGFDSRGAFTLQLREEGIRFIWTRPNFGWLATSEDGDSWFPQTEEEPLLPDPLSFAHWQKIVGNTAGIVGGALRAYGTSVWKPLGKKPVPTLNRCTNLMLPISRILAAQGLPDGRLIVSSKSLSVFTCRTPRKHWGLLIAEDTDVIPKSALLTDRLLEILVDAEDPLES